MSSGYKLKISLKEDMHRANRETLSLPPEESKRAKRLLKRIEDGDVQSPNDIVDSWEEPDGRIDWERKNNAFPHHEGFIDPAAIAGSVDMTGRLEKHRIKKILVHMLKGEFEVQHTAPPVLQRRGDHYYVSSDGHHRSVVAKAIGLGKLYTEYEVIPPELIVREEA